MVRGRTADHARRGMRRGMPRGSRRSATIGHRPAHLHPILGFSCSRSVPTSSRSAPMRPIARHEPAAVAAGARGCGSRKRSPAASRRPRPRRGRAVPARWSWWTIRVDSKRGTALCPAGLNRDLGRLESMPRPVQRPRGPHRHTAWDLLLAWCGPWARVDASLDTPAQEAAGGATITSATRRHRALRPRCA